MDEFERCAGGSNDNDWFVWESGDGGSNGQSSDDRISDFNASNDKIDLSGLLNNLSGYNASNVSDFVTLTNGASSVLTIDLDGLAQAQRFKPSH